MFSKEEAKKIREEFWDSFKKLSAGRRARKGLPRNWMLAQTGIKALNLRFHVDRENGKSVSRIYLQLEGVDIYNRETWPGAFQFMYKNMMKLEAFFREYRDILKDA